MEVMEVRKKMIALSITIIIITLYLVMFFNTNQVVEDVENVMESKVDRSVTEGLPIHMYNRKGLLDLEATSYNVKIRRIFVIHNLFEGYIWVNYTRQGFDDEGNLVHGSWEIPSRWRIKRMNGEWEIVEIEEAP